MKIVIRAGGVGSRLWPVSRQHNPKQFHALTSDQSMIEDAIDRVRDMVDMNDVFISTNVNSAEKVSALSNIVSENVIVEPARKDTAAAIGLESIVLRKHDPEAIVASLGSDHSVKNVQEFQHVLKVAEEFVQKNPEYIVPIAIRPTQPDTGMGYIKYTDVIETVQNTKVYAVERFTEKPDKPTAKQFLQEGNYLWNANMFVWKVSTILDLYEQHLPEMYAQLLKIEEALGTDKQEDVLQEIYPQLEKVAVDYAIIEKTDKIATVPADIGWNDIGDWARLKDEVAEQEADNVAINADHKSLETKNTLVYTATKGKTVATIGVENLIIVETDDALLIADKYHSQDVKKIVEQLEEDGKDNLL